MTQWQNAAVLVRRFAARELTNDAFEAAFEENAGDDRALFDIGLVLWRFYDDLSTHRLDGRHALTPRGEVLFERCARFLETQHAYHWPVTELWPVRIRRVWNQLRGMPSAPPPVLQPGDPEAWPFHQLCDDPGAPPISA